MKARTHKKTLMMILLALVVASIVVTGSSAGSPQHGAVPASLAQIQQPGGVSDFDTYNFVEPTGVYESVLRQPTSAGAATAGFAWRDAAIGGSFVFGLGLLAAGGVLAVRRQRPVAQSHA